MTLDFVDDLQEFDQAVRKAIEGSTQYFDVEKLNGRDDFVFFSSLPWFVFTGIDHTLSLKKEDAMPRIAWGKFFESQGRILLPYNIQVNHMFVDGIHVGKFFEELGKEISRMVAFV